MALREQNWSSFVADQDSGGRTTNFLGDEAAAEEAPPARIGPYRIVAELGRGGMGIVYSAVDERLERPVALKVLQSGRARTDDRLRFVREARVMARLSKHPNIVQVHAVERADGREFLVMDLVPGPTLADVLERGPLGPRRAAELGEKIALALDHAHRHGLVHRDVKPSNVLIAPSGEPQMTDFGLAHDTLADERLSATGEILGTPAYMAPEQANASEEVDARADIYGMGALLYHMVTGRPPIVGRTWLATVALAAVVDPTPPRAIRRDVPRDLEAVIEKCLERDPARRYATAGDLALDLACFLRGEPVSARRRSGVRRAAAYARRRPARTVAAAALAGAIAAVAIVLPSVLAERRRAASEAIRARALVESTALGRILVLDRAIEVDATNWQALMDRARARVERSTELARAQRAADAEEQIELAMRDYDLALAANPGAAYALLGRAQLKKREGDREGAARDLDRVIALDPDGAAAYIARGLRKHEDGDAKGAIEDYGRAIALAPERADAYVNRGNARADARDFAGAIADYEKAIELDPANPKAHYNRARLYQFYKGDMRTALEGFARAVELDPTDGNSYFALGNIKRLIDPPDLAGAEADFRRAMELAPWMNGPAINLGILLFGRGAVAEARAALTRGIELDPRPAVGYFYRARCALAATPPDPEGARRDLDLCLERESRLPEPWAIRGELRAKAGDREGALADLEAALARMPEGAAEARGEIETKIAALRAGVEETAAAK